MVISFDCSKWKISLPPVGALVDLETSFHYNICLNQFGEKYIKYDF